MTKEKREYPLIYALQFIVCQGDKFEKKVKEFRQLVLKSEFKFTKKCVSIGISGGELTESKECYANALKFKKKKQFVKETVSHYNLLLTFLLIFLFPPLCFYYRYADAQTWEFFVFGFLSLVLSFSIGILISVIENFIIVVLDKHSISYKVVFRFLLWSLLCYLIIRFYNNFDYVGLTLFSVAFTINMIFTSQYLNIILIEPLVDLFMYKRKVLNSHNLLIESAFNLSVRKYSIQLLKKNIIRNNAIRQVEQFSDLVESEWQSQINCHDSKTHLWKQKTFSGIANSIRKNKKLLIIPSIENCEKLANNFNLYFENIIKNNWQVLLDEEVPAGRIKKKNVIFYLKLFFIAFLPISAYFLIEKFCPVIPEYYKPVALLFSIIWLVMNILMWLDPSLLDKLSAAKSAKAFFNKTDD